MCRELIVRAGFVPLFSFISHFLAFKVFGVWQGRIITMVRTASSLEILLSPTQKCMWENPMVESKADHL